MVHQRAGVAFWTSAAIGAAIVAFGVRGLLENEPRGAESAVRWFIAGALVIDLILVPIGAALGLVGRRLAPSWAWPVIRAALFTSVVLVAFALPLVTDQGGTPGNPTVRPRDYERGLALALGVTWVLAAVALAVRHLGRSAR